MAESQGITICDILGISKTNVMSENELNWWLARSTKKPFLGDQINIYGAKEQKRSYVDWFYVDPSEDEDFVRDGLQKIKDIKEKRNG